jgi:hypothetical protein
MINPYKYFSEKSSEVTPIVFSFTYKSPWCGVRAVAFLTQEQAEEAWIAAVTGDGSNRAELLRLRASDEDAFLEKMEELRDPMDAFCIIEHRLDVAVPTGDSNRVLRFSATQSEVEGAV